ncbi:hypothetical protein [Undibacter mobilis]|uniref:Uncharacterized protein n=1 Tax=Undibacter mobilis TaxID=2292256 RepID=A0A371BD18_9BRAD|nr:hypothetical protein [Undibacter mobilis]RDV05499.1 hypothetical protein DXH78_13505 [Undibacter mobilis]
MSPSAPATVIALRTATIAHLFSSLDPSPFRQKDLDAGVEEFIAGWVRELPAAEAFEIVVHLPESEAAKPDAARIPEAFAHYFTDRAIHAEQELRELFRLGRRFLGIGIVVLIGCLTASQIAAAIIPNKVAARVLEESLIIVGWVANWKPIEIYLYDWVPIRRRINLYRRMAAAPIRVSAD